MESLPFDTLIYVTLILVLTYLIYTKILLPYRQYRIYRDLLCSNYKTKVNSFNIFGTQFLSRNKKHLEQHGDTQYFVKFQLRNYQVSLNMLCGQVFVDLIDPHLVRQFFDKTLEGCYVKSNKFPFFGGVKALVGQGLLFSQGSEWKKKRKIMSSVFNYDFIKSKVPVISAICEEVLNELEKQNNNDGKTEVKADVIDVLQKIFGNVVIKCFFGQIQLDNINGKSAFTFVNNLMEQNSKRTMTILPFLLGSNFHKYNLRKMDRQVAKNIKIFDQYAQSVIKKHIKKLKSEAKQTEKTHNGIVDMLLKQNKLRSNEDKSDQKNEDFYTQKDLVDEFKTFFMAGTDTTANNTTILIYQLAKYPEVQQKIRKQISQVIEKDHQNVSFEDLKKLTYLQCVQKETLRMYSPSAGIFHRQAVRDHFIDKIPIKKGMIVTIKMKPNHFKEQFYQNPQIFNPDRWIGFDASKTDPYAYFPFSSGQRNCIGQHLALIESKVIIIALLRRYKTISLEKPQFRLYMRTLYGAQKMTTTFTKFDKND